MLCPDAEQELLFHPPIGDQQPVIAEGYRDRDGLLVAGWLGPVGLPQLLGVAGVCNYFCLLERSQAEFFGKGKV